MLNNKSTRKGCSINELDTFLVEFITEIDGTLNEVNARTMIEVNID